MKRHHEMPTGELWNKSEQERKMPSIWRHTARAFSSCVPLSPTHTEDRGQVPAALRPRSSASPQPGDQRGGSCQENEHGIHHRPSCPGTRAQSGTATRPPALHANRHDSSTIPAVRREMKEQSRLIKVLGQVIMGK